MEARPQKAYRDDRASHESSAKGRMLIRGGRGRPKTRIQGGWAAEARLPRREQGKGRSQPNFRGRGYQRTLRGYCRPDPTREAPHNDGSSCSGLNPNSPVFHPQTSPGVSMEEPSRGLPYPEYTDVPQCNIGQPLDLMRQGYTFVPPDEQVSIVQENKPRIIEDDGEYTISEGPSGKSRIVLFKNFLDKKEADEALDQLQQQIEFIQQVNKNRAGHDYLEPRLVRWFGEHPYAYSKVRMEANEEWPPALLRLKEKIEEANCLNFNSVLANMYRSGKDGVAWHSDDEYGLREQPKIASLSLGETRMFEMRKKPPKGINPYDYDFSTTEKLMVPLTHGALLLMTGHTQDDWQHQIPKEYHDKDLRINLTFRTIYPDERHAKNQDRVSKLN